MLERLRNNAGPLTEILLWALMGAGLLNLLWALDNPVTRQILYNADTLYPAMLHRDLVENGGTAGGWITPPSLQFFPDIILYFAQASFIKDMGARQLVYAMLQYIALVGASLVFTAGAFSGDERRSDSARRLVLAGALPPLFFAARMEINQGYLIAFLCAHHLGAWIITLLCGALLLHPRTRFRALTAVFLFPLICTAIVSDPLFIVLFIPAALLTVILHGEATRKRRVLFILLIMLALLAGLRLQAMARNGLPMTMLNYEIAARLKTAALALDQAGFVNGGRRALEYFARDVPWIAWLAGPLALAAAAFRPRGRPETVSRRAALYFLGTALLVNLLVLVTTAALIDFFATRYLPALFFVYMPTLGLLATFLPARESDSRTRKNLRALVPAVILTAVLLVIAGRRVPGPALARCLDEHINTAAGVAGYGDYWHASPVNLYSRKGIRLLQVGAAVRPHFRANSFLWYTASAAPSFIVTDRLNEKTIRALFGNPARVITCGGSRIFLFDDRQKAKLRAHHARMITDIGAWRILTGR